MIIENAVRHESTSDSGAISVSIIATLKLWYLIKANAR